MFLHDMLDNDYVSHSSLMQEMLTVLYGVHDTLVHIKKEAKMNQKKLTEEHVNMVEHLSSILKKIHLELEMVETSHNSKLTAKSKVVSINIGKIEEKLDK